MVKHGTVEGAIDTIIHIVHDAFLMVEGGGFGSRGAFLPATTAVATVMVVVFDWTPGEKGGGEEEERGGGGGGGGGGNGRRKEQVLRG